MTDIEHDIKNSLSDALHPFVGQPTGDPAMIQAIKMAAIAALHPYAEDIAEDVIEVDDKREQSGRLVEDVIESMRGTDLPFGAGLGTLVECGLFAERYRAAAGLVPFARVKAVLESAREAYSDHPGLSRQPQYQAAYTFVLADFYEDLIDSLDRHVRKEEPMTKA